MFVIIIILVFMSIQWTKIYRSAMFERDNMVAGKIEQKLYILVQLNCWGLIWEECKKEGSIKKYGTAVAFQTKLWLHIQCLFSIDLISGKSLFGGGDGAYYQPTVVYFDHHLGALQFKRCAFSMFFVQKKLKKERKAIKLVQNFAKKGVF